MKSAFFFGVAGGGLLPADVQSNVLLLDYRCGFYFAKSAAGFVADDYVIRLHENVKCGDVVARQIVPWVLQ